MIWIMVANAIGLHHRSVDSNRLVADLLKTDPHSLGVFETFHIDFCCAGKLSLAEACVRANVALADVELALNEAGEGSAALPNLPNELHQLVRYVEETHHSYARGALGVLVPLAEKVAAVHGQKHAELAHLRGLVEALADDLEPHMLKEERVLFPYLHELAQCRSARTQPTRPGFGTVKTPIAMMLVEHDRVGELLAAIEEATRDPLSKTPFSPPNDGCSSYQALFSGLAELVRDVRRHVFIENELIFPQALALESQPM